MEDSKVQAKVCDACGAKIRGGSVYCYNCGGQLNDTNGSAESVDAVPPMPRPLAETLRAELEITELNGSASRPPGTRRSRSTFVRRERKPTEVVWEQKPESGMRFLALTLVLVLLAVALLITAMYLR